jgi:hypothetical protein
MTGALLEKYRSLMISTRLASMVAASWMLVIAGYDITGFTKRAVEAENPSWPMIVRELIFLSIVAIGFVGRLIALIRIKRLKYGFVAASWLFVAIASWWYFTEAFPMDGRAIYSLFYFDRLASWCLIFLFLSIVRFVITAFTALLLDSSDEFGTYS